MMSVVPHLNITDDAKEWRKELAEAMVIKGFGKVENGIARGGGGIVV